MKVMVTGGAGYIGSHAVAALLERGHQVFVIDNLSTGYENLLNPSAPFFKGDVKDSRFVRGVIENNAIEAVLHFAAFTSVAESVSNPEKYYDNNFGGTLGLLEAIKNTSSVKYFIFSSTAAVYADPGGKPVTENSSTNPPTAYGRSKLMSEQALQDFAAVSGLKVAILRYFNVAGASSTGLYGQIGDEHTVLIKRAALAAVGKIPELQIFGTDYATPDGTAVRDYIHVEDLVDLHVLSLEKLAQGREIGILNCGYGRGFSVREVIETMKRASGRDFVVVEKARRSGDLASVVADNAKSISLFSWKPRFSNLEKICSSAFQWELRGR